MARIQWVEERLIRWAQGITVGDGNGYPAMSIIHPSWQPPTPGQTPTLKVGRSSDVKQTHAAIGALSDRARATLVVHYILKPPIAEQAQLLECQERTVHDRVERVHRELAVLLDWRGAAAGNA